MTRLESTIRQVSDLREFYLRIKSAYDKSTRKAGTAHKAATISKQKIHIAEKC